MSATPPTTQEHVTNSVLAVPRLEAAHAETPHRRWFGLAVVLFVSFAHFIASSTYHAMGGIAPADSYTQARLVGAIIAEAGALAVLWYVLSGQARSWKNIGWNLGWTDIPRALVLVFGSMFAAYVVVIPAQVVYRAYSGHYLAPKSVHGLLGFGISVLSFAFVCLNPFFEELIVRGYLMTEILDLSGKGVLAVLVSVAVQMSYHLYQGVLNCISLTAIFTVFSIYFLRSRRLAPLVLAHLCIDLYALLRASV